jgi:hypothetical protein
MSNNLIFPENLSHVSRREALDTLEVKSSTLGLYQRILNEMRDKNQISSEYWDYAPEDRGFSTNSLMVLLIFRSLIKKSSIKSAIKQIKGVKLHGI